MTVKEAIYEKVGELDDERAARLLFFLNHLMSAPKEDYPVEQREYDDTQEILRNAKPLSENDPLWGLIGIGFSSEPTDVENRKDEYVAESFDAEG
ncbi:MAG: hypothetical protein ACR2OO_08935 [Thermomicrobiales bacterium]